MLTRRNLLKTSGLLTLGTAAPYSAYANLASARPTLPDRANFRVQEFETCLNSGRWHPLSNGARAAVDRYHKYKQRGIWARKGLEGPADPAMHGGSQPEAKALFAQLINATPDEIAFVQSTTAGENLVVRSLGLPADNANIVTDGLHFEGSLYLYDSLRRGGMDVRIVRPRDWKIQMDDLKRAIDKNTRLVAISLISFVNGFEHDLKAVCELAHQNGALVYTDMVQAAGAMPIDVRASGVDFCATASYKWLMGDFGLGFLYVNQALLGSRILRPVHSYNQVTQYATHMFPYDSPGKGEISYEQLSTAAGYYQQGTLASAVTETLAYSLQYIQTLGVNNIQRHSQELIGRLRTEVPRLGHELITPANARGPLVAFSLKDPLGVAAKLSAAKVDVTITDHRMRISPAVFNDHNDIDRLLQALST
jgi:selenocysteine lyase/cysteine desulfurase